MKRDLNKWGRERVGPHRICERCDQPVRGDVCPTCKDDMRIHLCDGECVRCPPKTQK